MNLTRYSRFLKSRTSFALICVLAVALVTSVSAAVVNRTMALQGYTGANITSAAALPLGATVGNFFSVTGTTAVTSATVLANSASAGRVLTLKFNSAGVVIPETATGIALSGPYCSDVASTLTLFCDGTNWREVARRGDAAFTKDLGTSEALILLDDIALGSNDRISGVVQYSIYVIDGTDFQCRSGFMPFSAVSKAGTITAVGNTVSTEAEDLAASSGTLTSAITVVAGTGKITIKAQPVSSLTQTGATMRFRVIVNDRGTVAGNGVQTIL